VALQTPQSKFDSCLALNNCPGGGIGRHAYLESNMFAIYNKDLL